MALMRNAVCYVGQRDREAFSPFLLFLPLLRIPIILQKMKNTGHHVGTLVLIIAIGLRRQKLGNVNKIFSLLLREPGEFEQILQ